MNTIFRGAVGFVVGYLVFMLPTYVLPYLGSNSAIVGAVGVAVGRGLTPQFWLHAWCLGMLVLVTSIRGRYIGKGWLLIFPVLAGFFDLVPVLNLIPLVPTVMHLLALVLGAKGSAAVLSDHENANELVGKDFSWEPWAAGLMSLSAISGTIHFVAGVKATGKQVMAPSVPASESGTSKQAATTSSSINQTSKPLLPKPEVKKSPRPTGLAREPEPKKVEDKPVVRYIDINK